MTTIERLPDTHFRLRLVFAPYGQFYANALRDVLRKTNNRRQETLRQMSQEDWRIAVFREMHTELWYEQPGQDGGQYIARAPNMNAVTANKNSNSPKVTVAAVSGDV